MGWNSTDKLEIGDFYPMIHPVYKDIIVADSKPDIHRNQDLYLFNINSGNNRHIGSFYSPVEFVKEKRCDIHPRWDRTGDYIFIDTPYHGRRSIAVIDVSALNGKLPF